MAAPNFAKTVKEAAIAYAKAGLRVFPAFEQNNKKIPAYKGWKDRATTDPVKVEKDFNSYRGRATLIGWVLPDEIIVLDLDVGHFAGQDGIADFQRLDGRHPDDVNTPQARSPRGGRHLFFRRENTDTTIYRNSQNIFDSAIEVKKLWIVLPSIGIDQRIWIKDLGTDFAPIPDWVRKIPSDHPVAGEERPYIGPTPFAEQMLAKLCNKVENAPDGRRNITLWWAAYTAGGYIAGGVFEEEPIRQALFDVAIKFDPPLFESAPELELMRTIKRGITEGKQKPLNAPEEGSKLLCEDFAAFLPDHKYIYRKTGELWIMAGVNAAVKGEVKIINGEETYIPASRLIDRQKPVHQMSWVPGGDEFIENVAISTGGQIVTPNHVVYNLYKGPTVQLVEGDHKPWLDHIKNIYPKNHEHIVHWMAHRVQRPGEKVNHALLLGGVEGVGKDTMLEPLRRAVGPWNFADINPEKIFDNFNEYVKSTILRISEAKDLGEFNRYQFYDATKTLIAAPPETLQCNPKYVRQYYVPNVTGVIITTNYKTAGLYLPITDRRHYVAWSDSRKEDFTEKYWNEIWTWYYQGGFEIVAHYLTNLDISGFNPKIGPPQTDAFWEIVNASQGTEVGELSDLLELLKSPKVVTVAKLKEQAECHVEFAGLLGWMLKSPRIIPEHLGKQGYRVVKNPGEKTGRWAIKKIKHTLYARQDVSDREAMVAYHDLLQEWERNGKMDKAFKEIMPF